MIDPEKCSTPRCQNDSLFSTVGLVGGRCYPQCHSCALNYIARDLANATADMEALRSVTAEVPGQAAMF